VIKRDLGKLTAPGHGDRDTKAQGEQLVATILAAVEARVGEFPHAVDGVGAIRLTKDVIESHLDVVIEIVWISVDKI